MYTHTETRAHACVTDSCFQNCVLIKGFGFLILSLIKVILNQNTGLAQRKFHTW